MSSLKSSLLAKSIDDIDDLPGFEVPSNGMYSLKFNTAIKEINNKEAVEASFEVIECIEKNDAADPDTKPGTKFSTLFFLGNEVAEGKMKELVMPVANHFGVRDMEELITQTCKDLIVVAKVKRRADKEDKERFYADVSNLTIT